MRRWIMITAASLSLAGNASAASAGQPLSESTRRNLLVAMKGEAFAAVKYRLYAEAARKAGDEDLARTLEGAARQEEHEHFREEAALYGLVGANASNLREAIAGETYESTTMYRQFAADARKNGDSAAADLFDEIADDEAKHAASFQSYLDGGRR